LKQLICLVQIPFSLLSEKSITQNKENISVYQKSSTGPRVLNTSNAFKGRKQSFLENFINSREPSNPYYLRDNTNFESFGSPYQQVRILYINSIIYLLVVSIKTFASDSSKWSSAPTATSNSISNSHSRMLYSSLGLVQPYLQV